MNNTLGDANTIWLSGHQPSKKSLLSISKKLEEHCIVKAMYGERPNYVEFANKITSKKFKSPIGLEDNYKHIVAQAKKLKRHAKTRPKQRPDIALQQLNITANDYINNYSQGLSSAQGRMAG